MASFFTMTAYASMAEIETTTETSGQSRATTSARLRDESELLSV